MENKMTNLMALNFVVEHCELPTDVMEKITNIRNSYQKKAEYKPTGERKPTATQLANEDLKFSILDFMSDGSEYTIADLAQTVPCLEGVATQKITALMYALLGADKVTKRVEKRKAIFTIA